MAATLSVQEFEHQLGTKWRCHCSCGWHSKNLPFPDPDAAYHCGTLHHAAAHPEQIDWEEETRKFKRQHGLT